MDKIKNKIENCHLCGNLPKLADVYMQTGKTKFIIIGESPAKDGWIASKKAFYNTAGKLQGSGRVLEKLLNSIGLKIEDIFFTECCKCIIEDRNTLKSIVGIICFYTKVSGYIKYKQFMGLFTANLSEL